MLVSAQSVCLSATPWNAVHQAPLSMEFSWQEYWSGLPFYPPGDLPGPGIKPKSLSPALQADSLLLSHWESLCILYLKAIKCSSYGHSESILVYTLTKKASTSSWVLGAQF